MDTYKSVRVVGEKENLILEALSLSASGDYEKTVFPIVDAILIELDRAREMHIFPSDVIHRASIVAEEAGEALQAANSLYHSGKGSLEDVRHELIQTGAMAIRALINLDSMESFF